MVYRSHDKEVQSYSLIANIVHRGSFDSGHYVCYAKRGDDVRYDHILLFFNFFGSGCSVMMSQ